MIRPLIVLMALSAVTPAADMQSWHGAEFQALNHGPWAVRVRGEYRTGSQWPVAAQFRGGPEVRFRAHPRISLIGLYHAIEGKTSGGDWEEYNRLFGGVEIPITSGRFSLTSRTAAERFFGSDAPGLSRYREMLRLRFPVKLSPYASTEVFFGHHGLIGVRPNAGLVLPLGRQVGLDVGYHMDWREPRYGGLRHIVYTYLRIRKAT